MKDYIIARAKEASTWRGIFLLAAAFGMNPQIASALSELAGFVLGNGDITPATAAQIGLAASGIIGITAPDKK